MKKLIALALILLATSSVYAAKPYFSLDVAKNAATHNNLGLIRLEDGYYDMAIAEFQLAIDLNPTSKACATYYNNLGTTYMKIGSYKQAQTAFESAIKISPLVFLYYQNVVQSYKMQGLLGAKIKQYQQIESTNSLYMVMLGLCYIESGDIKRGIIKLDEFCLQEPYLITTSGVKKYLKEITEEYQ
ncbi:tetratricopeptide repeat protein [bacterium]|nr:tetratricopeptide repeat protein [bacterium]